VAPVFNTFVAASEFVASLDALANEDRVYVLSSPSIMTSENKKAVINPSMSPRRRAGPGGPRRHHPDLHQDRYSLPQPDPGAGLLFSSTDRNESCF